jgi:FlaA1/EpsC-like NDP-sugar epimerase
VKFFLLRTIPVLALEESLLVAMLLLAYAVSFNLASLYPVPVAVLQAVLAACVLKGLVLFGAHFHRVWRTPASLGDIASLAGVNLLASLVFAAGIALWLGRPLPLAVWMLDFLFCLMLSEGVRFAAPIYTEMMRRGILGPDGDRRKVVLIYGAGQAGLTLLREFRSNPALGNVAGFLDDDDSKRGAHLIGTPVFGIGRNAAKIVDRLKHRGIQVEEIIVAMPSATGRQMQEAAANCRAAGVTCKTVPGLGELLQGKFFSQQIRSISLTDLLGRQPVELEENRIRDGVRGRSVMITGAGGSIGSELCRQIARHGPARLVAFDKSESDVFRLEIELRTSFPDLPLVPVIGDIRDLQSVDEAIVEQRVESIFHAGAYKHVPLMEGHGLEALHTNVIGTWNVASCAMRRRVASFLMISTDKAVNPTNIMGTTKRAAELIVASMQNSRQNQGTRFVSVRFGNVLGSNGSVVPVFQNQIAAGGPVTVTHPEIRRYFMTIPEAVQLVLQASVMGNGGEIFVLDMGDPVRIVDLARNMIRLAGRVPDEEIEIRFVGLRPGEKLYEELISEGENILPTYHRKIKIFRGPVADPERIEEWLHAATRIVAVRHKSAVVPHLKAMVPEYAPPRQSAPAGVAPQRVPDATTLLVADVS